MSKEQMEISLTSLVTREMTIKSNETPKRLHYNGCSTKCWRECGATRIAMVEVERSTTTLKNCHFFFTASFYFLTPYTHLAYPQPSTFGYNQSVLCI